MAAPTRTKIGAGSSKSTLNGSLTITASTTVVIGDQIEVVIGTDPNAAVTAVSTGGTATFSPYVGILDIISPSGSGTSGARLTVVRMQCTGAGTVTGIAVTAGTTGPRTAEFSVINGADTTTPVMISSNTNSVTIPTTGRDLAATSALALENAAGVALTSSKSGTDAANWTAGTADATSIGTSGTPASSNISIGAAAWYRTNSAAAAVTLSTAPGSGVIAQGIVVWQAPAVAPSGTVSKARVSGSIVTASDKVMVAGTPTSVTLKVMVAGVLV